MVEARPILSVIAIGLGCALALAGTNRLTKAPIARNETAEARAAIAALIPAAETATRLPDLDRNPGLWAYCGGALLGRSDADGYGGPIRLLYAISQPVDGPAILAGLALLSHQETPGIADFLRDPAWLASLSGRTAAELAGLDAVSGATITVHALKTQLAKALADPPALHGPPVRLDCGQ